MKQCVVKESVYICKNRWKMFKESESKTTVDKEYWRGEVYDVSGLDGIG